MNLTDDEARAVLALLPEIRSGRTTDRGRLNYICDMFAKVLTPDATSIRRRVLTHKILSSFICIINRNTGNETRCTLQGAAQAIACATGGTMDDVAWRLWDGHAIQSGNHTYTLLVKEEA